MSRNQESRIRNQEVFFCEEPLGDVPAHAGNRMDCFAPLAKRVLPVRVTKRRSPRSAESTWRMSFWWGPIAAMLCLLPLQAHAKALVADIASQRIEIHSAFTGIQLPMYGARNDSGDVLIVVRGPEKDFTVRKKERVWGIWVNREAQTYENIPSYFALASSRALENIQESPITQQLKLRPKHFLENQKDAATSSEFARALFDHLSENQLLVTHSGEIIFLDETLFKKVFAFPDTVPRGLFTAEVYLVSDGQLVGMHSTPVKVEKIGLDAFMYDAATHHSLAYGLAAIFLAVGAGWLASQLFERI